MTVVKSSIRFFGCAFASLGLIEIWRENEKLRIRNLTEKLAQFGMVKIQGSSSRAKTDAWNVYLPYLLNTWNEVSKSVFKIDDIETWPHIPNGRALEYAHKSHSHYPIRLWQDHYEAQAVVACFIDNELDGSVHWGETTHWKLKLLISPFYTKLLPFLNTNKIANMIETNDDDSGDNDDDKRGSGNKSIQLEGSENAWGIVNFPMKQMNTQNSLEATQSRRESNDEGGGGLITPRHAHIDGGRRGMFSKGLPFPKHTSSEHYNKEDLETSLMQLFAAQTVIQLYCTTPGDLGVYQGSTGLYEGSHLILAAALARLYAVHDHIDWSDVVTVLKSLTPTTTTSSSSSSLTSTDESLTLKNKSLNENNYLEKVLSGLLRQFDIKEEESVLMVGTCIHGSMYALEPMKTSDGREFPRVIMNAKSYIGGRDTESGRTAKCLSSFITSRITTSTSPARNVMIEPKQQWVNSGKSEKDFEERVQHLCDAFENKLK